MLAGLALSCISRSHRQLLLREKSAITPRTFKAISVRHGAAHVARSHSVPQAPNLEADNYGTVRRRGYLSSFVWCSQHVRGYSYDMLAPPEREGKESLPVNEAFTLRGHDGPVLGVRFNKAGTYCLSCGKVSHMPATPSSGMDQSVFVNFSCPSSDELMSTCRTVPSSYGIPTKGA